MRRTKRNIGSLIEKRSNCLTFIKKSGLLLTKKANNIILYISMIFSIVLRTDINDKRRENKCIKV